MPRAPTIPTIHPFGMGSLSYPSSCLHSTCNALVYDGIFSVATNVCFVRQFGANFQFPSHVFVISYFMCATALCKLSPSFHYMFWEVQIHCHLLSKSSVGNETPKISLLSNQIGIVALRFACVCFAVGMRHARSLTHSIA